MNFNEFYSYYLLAHSNPICRLLHFIGTSQFFIVIAISIFTREWILLPFSAIGGYLLAWTGHYFFEKNKPETLNYPRLSAKAGRIMFFHMLTGKLDFTSDFAVNPPKL